MTIDMSKVFAVMERRGWGVYHSVKSPQWILLDDGGHWLYERGKSCAFSTLAEAFEGMVKLDEELSAKG